MASSPAALQHVVWQSEVERYKREVERKEQQILALEGQVEYERSRANCIRAEASEEQRRKYQSDLGDYKREVSEKYTRSVKMLNDAAEQIASRRSEVEDSLRTQVTQLLQERERAEREHTREMQELRMAHDELKAELAVEAVNREELVNMKDARIRSAEEEVEHLMARLQREVAAHQQVKRRAHDAAASMDGVKEDAQKLRDRLKIAASEKECLSAEIAKLNVRLQSVDGQNKQLERSLTAARAETAAADSAAQTLRRKMYDITRP
eukprot:TRINITY_DN25619_c0_g1_i1.p1 TRINITY_DN25619_c0_g1~~TRINITY_DN25619_c0_g1_i1.p1  ORF type:complete len:266 (+),score=86.86 TRINITY_DN25619_c0_g1_i1:107-904(+)